LNDVMQIIQNNTWLFYLIIAWSVIWKAIALWHAARNTQLVWYIVLVVVNTIGILEIIYLLFFRKKSSYNYRL